MNFDRLWVLTDIETWMVPVIQNFYWYLAYSLQNSCVVCEIEHLTKILSGAWELNFLRELVQVLLTLIALGE